MTEASWEGELEGLRSTSCGWIYFGGHLLETCSSTQQIAALSTTESEYILIKDVAHVLEMRSALAECGMTLKMVGKTDVTAGRATAARRGVGRVRHFVCRRRDGIAIPAWITQRGRPGVEDGRIDFAFEWNTPSTTNESSWMVAASFNAVAESARDCRVSMWNVKNTCETNGWFQICAAARDRQECCVVTSNETSSNTMQDIQDPDCCVES